MATIKLRGKMWCSDLYINGKRVRHTLSRYKPEAKAMLREMVERRRAEKRGEIVRNMGWKIFQEVCLKESKVNKSLRTYQHDRYSFRVVDETTHVARIEDMTPERLARIRVEAIESGRYSSASLVRAIRGIVTAMRWAEDRKYVRMQNWRIVQKINKEAGGRIDYYTQDSFLELLSKLEGDFFTAALVMGRAGLRLGEMLHLEWPDVQFEHRRILFRSKPHLGWKIKGDRFLKKIRSVPMLTADLRQHLESLRRPTGFVLSDKIARKGNKFGIQIRAALKGTEIKTVGGNFGFPHILRHSFASQLVQVGVPLKKIANWLGHSSVSMTEKYAHLAPPDSFSDLEIGEKLVSSLCPVKSQEKQVTAILSHSNEESGMGDLSTKSAESNL